MQPRQQIRALDGHVGRRVRTRRTQLGLSQTELGLRLGLSFQQIQNTRTAATGSPPARSAGSPPPSTRRSASSFAASARTGRCRGRSAMAGRTECRSRWRATSPVSRPGPPGGRSPTWSGPSPAMRIWNRRRPTPNRNRRRLVPDGAPGDRHARPAGRRPVASFGGRRIAVRHPAGLRRAAAGPLPVHRRPPRPGRRLQMRPPDPTGLELLPAAPRAVLVPGRGAGLGPRMTAGAERRHAITSPAPALGLGQV